MGWEPLRVDSGGEAGETFEQGVGRGVEVLVRDAVDASAADGCEMLPVPLSDYSFERDAVSGSAPGEDEDVRVGFGDSFWGCLGSRLTEKAASGGFDQLGYPVLGVDEGLAPLFAVDERGVG